jgi:hypothetical protein
MGVERIEAWVEAFSERRMAFLAQPDAGRLVGRNGDGDDEETE